MEHYPLVAFQMWELVQFNEFVNHQIAKNVIIIDVEKMLKDSIFNLLHQIYPHVLLMPSIDMFHRYQGQEETIVICNLLSESPQPQNGHGSPLEKLLVDLFSNCPGYY